MAEMAEAEPVRSAVVKCEAHGLRYDSATQTGCVICRREAAGSPAPAAARAAAASGVTGAPAGRPLGPALLVTGLLLIATSAGLYLLHGAVVEAFQGLQLSRQPQPRALQKDEQMEKVQKELEALGQPGPAAEPGTAEPDLGETEPFAPD